MGLVERLQAMIPCAFDGCEARGTESYPLVGALGLSYVSLCPEHLEEARQDELAARRRQGMATADDWQTIPMADRVPLPVPSRVWTDAEWDTIRVGFIPRAMEDHWFLYVEGDTLHAHRSWTGYEVYEATFVPAGDGLVMIAEAWAAADPEVMMEGGLATEAARSQAADALLELIEKTLLWRF